MAVNLTDLLNGEDRETVKTLAKEKSVEDVYGILSGSNSNGEYTKFPDGTLICKHEIILPDTNEAAGVLYMSSTAPTWTFPIPFVGYFPQVNGSSSSTSYTWVVIQTSSLSSSIVRGWRGSTSSASITLQLVAIGRWE